MFYYISVDDLGKITQTIKSNVEITNNESLIRISEIVDVHNSEGKEYFYDESKGGVYFEYNLERLKSSAWDKCKELYSNIIKQGFYYKGVLYDADEKSRLSVLNARLAGIDVYWTAYDNSSNFFTHKEFADFHKSLTDWFSSTHSAMQRKRVEIDSSDSVSKVLAILDNFNNSTG